MQATCPVQLEHVPVGPCSSSRPPSLPEATNRRQSSAAVSRSRQKECSHTSRANRTELHNSTHFHLRRGSSSQSALLLLERLVVEIHFLLLVELHRQVWVQLHSRIFKMSVLSGKRRNKLSPCARQEQHAALHKQHTHTALKPYITQNITQISRPSWQFTQARTLAPALHCVRNISRRTTE